MTPSRVRIAPLEPPYDERARRLLSVMAPAGSAPSVPRLFTTLLRNIQLAESMQPLGRLLLRLSGADTLTRRHREIVILRVSANCRCEYEWGVHAATLSAKAGLTPAQIGDTLADEITPELWSLEDRLIFGLCDELHRTSTAGEQLWAGLDAVFDAPAILELLCLVGWYQMVAYISNVAGIEHESWAPRFATGARGSQRGRSGPAMD